MRKIDLGRPNHRWEDNIRIAIKEIGMGTGGLINSDQDVPFWRPLVNASLNLRVS